MNKKRTIRQWVAVVLMGIAAALIGASMFTFNPSDNESYATALGKRVEQRLGVLEEAVRTAAQSQNGTWLSLKDLPQDMVVYRYVEDTLQSWANQFPVRSDDIRSRAVVRRLGESRGDAVSPLAVIPETGFSPTTAPSGTWKRPSSRTMSG